MAYLGLSKIVAAIYDEKTNSYKDGFRFGKAMKADVSPNYEDVTDYNDLNDLGDEQVFTHADIELGTSYTAIEEEQRAFGHTSKNGEIVSCDTDLSNYVGVGITTKEVIGGVKRYIAIWFHKVKLYESGKTYNTKGESIEYTTPTTKGKAIPCENGEWRTKRIFETEEQADSWLNTLAGIKE